MADPGTGDECFAEHVISEDGDGARIGEQKRIIAEIQRQAGVEDALIFEGIDAFSKVGIAEHGQRAVIVEGLVTLSSEHIKSSA